MSTCICGRRHSNRTSVLENYLISNKEEGCEATYLSGKPRIKPFFPASSYLGEREDTNFKFSPQLHLSYCTSLLTVTHSIDFTGDSEALSCSMGLKK